MSDKPTRCIDPVIKYCQGCEWGWVHYPEWVETREDLADCTFESGCMLGFDQGRPEDEPTEEELKEFEYNTPSSLILRDSKTGRRYGNIEKIL